MTLRVGVIGVGAMGRNHARVYSELEGVELVGVADSREQVAESVARRLNVPMFLDYPRLLEEGKPDALTIAVPTVDHLSVALEAIDRGIHVLIEKPIAHTLDEGKQIIAAAEAAGVLLMVGHIERFNPAVGALKERIADNELGRVFQLDAHRKGPFPARIKDVGVVIDLAVHDLDIMRYVTDSEIVRVYAETERRIHSTREDLLTGLVRLSGGAIGSLAINWLTPTKIRELLVTGERGMFRVDYLTQDLYFFENATVNGPKWETLQMLRGVSEGKMIRYVVNKQEPLKAELESFIACVETGEAVPVSGQDGLRALELAEAVVLSGLEHRPVSMSPAPDVQD